MIKEAFEAWEKFDKILESALFDTIQSLEIEEGNAKSPKEYRFN